MHGQKAAVAALLVFACVTTAISTSNSSDEMQALQDFVIRPVKNIAPSLSAPRPDSTPPRDRLSIGINYTGGQVRWSFSRKWACEARVQFGYASSDYGDVKARVFGFRGYRFFNRGHRVSFYTGPELAFANAEAQNSSHKTSGMALGAFGGIHFPFASRFSLDTDIGPYVISLKEQQTGMSSTNLDFVLSSALVVRIF